MEQEGQTAAGTTKDRATPNERHLVSRARIRLYVHSSEGEVVQFDEMSFQDQLQFARQKKFHLPAGGAGTGSKGQDGASDPFQDTDCDPWKGMGPRPYRQR